MTDEAVAYKEQIIDEYAAKSTAIYSTSRMWDDGIIMARDLRRVIGLSLVTSLQAEI